MRLASGLRSPLEHVTTAKAKKLVAQPIRTPASLTLLPICDYWELRIILIKTDSFPACAFHGVCFLHRHSSVLIYFSDKAAASTHTYSILIKGQSQLLPLQLVRFSTKSTKKFTSRRLFLLVSCRCPIALAQFPPLLLPQHGRRTSHFYFYQLCSSQANTTAQHFLKLTSANIGPTNSHTIYFTITTTINMLFKSILIASALAAFANAQTIATSSASSVAASSTVAQSMPPTATQGFDANNVTSSQKCKSLTAPLQMIADRSSPMVLGPAKHLSSDLRWCSLHQLL